MNSFNYVSKREINLDKVILISLNKYVRDIFYDDCGKLIVVVPGSLITEFFLVVKNLEYFSFNYLNDAVCVDNLGKSPRFAVIYEVSDYTNCVSCSVVTFTDEGTPLPSIVSVFKSAEWVEREIWEMFGVYFVGNDNLRRLLTDTAFKGHPLRKDFPMTGYVEAFYTYHTNSIEFVDIELMQEFRTFEFYNNWFVDEFDLEPFIESDENDFVEDEIEMDAALESEDYFRPTETLISSRPCFLKPDFRGLEDEIAVCARCNLSFYMPRTCGMWRILGTTKN